MEASVCVGQKGTVEQITSRNIWVKVHREASCSHCNAKGVCFLGEDADRVLEFSNFTPGLKIGDNVEVTISRTMGNKAVFLGYLVPFLILISTLVSLKMIGASDWLSGIVSLAAMAPYFIILYLFRNRLKRTFTLSVRKK